jgi:Ribosomal protein L9
MADITNFGTYTAEVKLYSGITAQLYVEVGESNITGCEINGPPDF